MYWKGICILGLLLATACVGLGQAASTQLNQKPDERYKADVLLVVAHPDDEAAVSSFLAKLSLDQDKRIAVVFTNRGDGGGNEVGSERSTALGMIREIEARRSLASIGIQNVWFLDGRDTNTQNALISLANWQHSRVLEQMVRTVRLTRPEVVLTWLPALAGDHGDHQASGIIATEAFDMAGDPAIFPAQVTVRRGNFGSPLEGLQAWQPKKIYYFTDSLWLDLSGKTAAYDNKEISPLRKVSYEQVAAEMGSFHKTQEDYAPLADAIQKGELHKLLRDFKASLGFDIFPNPVRLFLGKSHVKSSTIGDVFEGITTGGVRFRRRQDSDPGKGNTISLNLGGPWNYYSVFWRSHNLDKLAEMVDARIYITAGRTLEVPLLVRNDTNSQQEIDVSLNSKLADGWSATSLQSSFLINAGEVYPMQIFINTPATPSDAWHTVEYAVTQKGRIVSTAALKVQLRRGTIPQ